MKNYKLLLFALSITGLVFTSCDPSVEAPGAEDTSKITYLPKITLNGESEIELDCDTSSFTDPGAIAEAGGTEIELITKTTGLYFGSENIDSPDSYTITYSAFNDDEIPAAAFRSVLWAPCTGDFVTSISGVYTSAIKRTPGYTTPEDVGPIYIKDMGNGVFAISDAIGGWYEHEYGYGPDYAATGMTVTANSIPLNDWTHDDIIGVGAFGGALEMTDFSVNPATKTIEFTTEWSFGYVFEVTLTQVN
ncbi:BT_2262 family domain-containing protein [Gaetbulibacter saemankumensis]|uniref:BT_2262 family domain-containing protein n=1 Tax=Gaetbulibacter saemankumensis TaxID=311208 RepID=UPI00042549D4|nr:BT_2262 family domain-containing protein [Gaetbulibacter saemankumensis]